MNDRPSTASERVVVGLGVGSDLESAIEAAVRLAADLEAEVLGLFVEDPSLAGVAALPAARLVGLTGAAAFDPAVARRVTRLCALAAERALASMAARHRVRWSFRQVSGRRPAALLAEASVGNLLAAGRGGRRMLPAAPVLLLDGGDDAAAALAHRIAAALGRALHAVAFSGGPEIEARLAALQERAHARGLPVTTERRGEAVDLAGLRRVIAERLPGLLVVPAAFVARLPPEDVEALLDALDMPVLLSH